MGPGLNSAIIAATSPSEEGLSSFIYRVMPALSNWNIPTVSPLDSKSKTFRSSKGISLNLIEVPKLASIDFTV